MGNFRMRALYIKSLSMLMQIDYVLIVQNTRLEITEWDNVIRDGNINISVNRNGVMIIPKEQTNE